MYMPARINIFMQCKRADLGTFILLALDEAVSLPWNHPKTVKTFKKKKKGGGTNSHLLQAFWVHFNPGSLVTSLSTNYVVEPLPTREAASWMQQLFQWKPQQLYYYTLGSEAVVSLYLGGATPGETSCHETCFTL